MPFNQESDKIPVLKMILKMFLYVEMNRVSVFFMYSFKILSTPGLLLFLRDLIAFLISASVISELRCVSSEYALKS